MAFGADSARVLTARADMMGPLKSALDQFAADCGRYPSTAEGLTALTTSPGNLAAGRWRGPYLEGNPRDPWGNEYRYACPGIHNPNGYDLYSCGADGISQTLGSDRDDISLWDPASPHGGDDEPGPFPGGWIHFFSGPVILAVLWMALRSTLNTKEGRKASLGKMRIGILSVFWLPLGASLNVYGGDWLPIIPFEGVEPDLLVCWCCGLVFAFFGLRSGTRLGIFPRLVSILEVPWFLIMPRITRLRAWNLKFPRQRRQGAKLALIVAGLNGCKGTVTVWPRPGSSVASPSTRLQLDRSVTAFGRVRVAVPPEPEKSQNRKM